MVPSHQSCYSSSLSWLRWSSLSHVSTSLRDWETWMSSSATLETWGAVLDIWLLLLPVPVYLGPIWEVNTGASALRSPNLFEDSVSHRDSPPPPLPLGPQPYLEPLSLALLFDASLSSAWRLSNTTVSTSHMWLLSSYNVASPKWDVPKVKMHTNFKDLVWRKYCKISY